MSKGKTDILQQQSYAMVGGDGAHSYAKNSSYQKGAVDAAKELINESIANNLDLKLIGFNTSKAFQVADLGCSTGPNTFIAVQNIIEAVEQKLPHETLEFQVLFNDHYDNDFNTLFKTLPPSRKYFASGVPGSFRDRLFPKSSLHIVHSSYALHWLSRIPEEIVDRDSPILNKDSIQCTGSVKGVTEAYAAQFENDTVSFLDARAEEIVPGGLIVILTLAMPDGIPMSETAVGVLYDAFGSCLNDLAKLGIISEEKVESFNLPIYNATPREVEAIIRRNKYFTVERLEELSNPVRGIPFTAQDYTVNFRAIFEEIVKNHFGNEYIDQIFDHFTERVAENLSFIEEKTLDIIDLFILLKRSVLND